MSLKPRIFFGIIMVGFLFQCGDSFDEKRDQATLSALRDNIVGMIGQPLCGGEGDCRYIAFGSKPCGGPWEYLIYSVSVTDSVELARKVNAYNDYEDMMNHKYGYFSDCGVPLPPSLSCENGVCVNLNVLIDN